MLCCWPRGRSARLANSILSLVFAIITGAAAPPPALAAPPAAAPDLGAWLAETGARALQATAPDNDPADGGLEALNRGVRRGFADLQGGGPTWLRRVAVEVDYRDDLQAAYDLTATQPLLRMPAQGDRLWLSQRVSHDPAGQTGGGLTLHYRPDALDPDLTLAVSGRVEDHWLQDYQRYGIGTSVRSNRFELGTTVYDDVPGSAGALGGEPDRRVDGYGIALGARVPELPWAWIRARKQWQIPADGEPVAVSDRLSLQFGPLLPLEIETGTNGEGGDRSWFAQLRFRIELGG